MGGPTVLILTGEPSGDRAAGRLAVELRSRCPDARLLAVGGRHLREAGTEILQDIASLGTMGFAEVVRQIPRLRRLEDRLRRLIDTSPPDVLVPVDYPGFNLRIARYAKSRGVPVVYYIGPQVWAWGANRMPRIARAVDRMLVVFAFEADLYRDAGIPVDFVGHPLLDGLASSPSREASRKTLKVGNGRPLLGLLPGSRVQEVRRIFPVMVEAARRVRERFPALAVVASVAEGVAGGEYRRVLGQAGQTEVVLREGAAATTCAAADVLLVTSGTATLEAALHGTPLAVLYRTSPVTWWIGKRLVKIPRIALVNIVAREELAAEFLQGDARPDRVAEHVAGLLEDPARRDALSRKLRDLRARLGEEGVARRAAGYVLREAGR